VIISEGWRITGYSEEPENKELMVIKGFRPVTTEEKTILNSKENEKNKALSEILSVIKSQGIEKIVAIDMTDNYDVVLDYDNRIKIKIEKPSDVEYKLKYAYKIITEELRENKSGYLIYRNQLGYSYVSKEEYDRINGNVSSSFSPDGEIKTTTSAVPEDTAFGTPVTEVTGTVSETAVSEVSVPSV
jgi:hypothetical protein